MSQKPSPSSPIKRVHHPEIDICKTGLRHPHLESTMSPNNHYTSPSSNYPSSRQQSNSHSANNTDRSHELDELFRALPRLSLEEWQRRSDELEDRRVRRAMENMTPQEVVRVTDEMSERRRREREKGIDISNYGDGGGRYEAARAARSPAQGGERWYDRSDSRHNSSSSQYQGSSGAHSTMAGASAGRGYGSAHHTSSGAYSRHSGKRESATEYPGHYRSSKGLPSGGSGYPSRSSSRLIPYPLDYSYPSGRGFEPTYYSPLRSHSHAYPEGAVEHHPSGHYSNSHAQGIEGANNQLQVYNRGPRTDRDMSTIIDPRILERSNSYSNRASRHPSRAQSARAQGDATVSMVEYDRQRNTNPMANPYSRRTSPSVYLHSDGSRAGTPPSRANNRGASECHGDARPQHSRDQQGSGSGRVAHYSPLPMSEYSAYQK